MIKRIQKFFSETTEKNKIYILSLLVGLVSGTAAFMLKNFIHYVSYFLTRHFSTSSESFFYLAYPMIGILISVLIVKYLIKDDISHGISKILSTLSKKGSHIKAHNMFSSMITSAFTIGFGGSVGAEAPIVYTGAAIGSNISKVFGLNENQMRLLIGCGATGAIAGIFKAPIAGIMFTLEVLMLDLTMGSLIPLLISGITAASLAYFFMGNEVLFHFSLENQFNYDNLLYYILLGILSGFISLYFTRVGMYVESLVKKISNIYTKLLFGGITLGVLIFVFPSLWGEGYESINKIFNGNGADILNNSLFFDWKSDPYFLMFILVLILVFKVFAMSITTSSGGVGGIFAPTLFMGAVGGYFLSFSLNTFLGLKLSDANFALVGMGSLMAGVMHAPLLGIFLIAEITGGYQLLVPLIISATVAYVTITRFEPHSIYTKRLAELGDLVTHHKDKAAMHFMNTKELIETDFEILTPDLNLGQMTYFIARSKRDLFPVVDENGMLEGMIKLNDIKNLIFEQDLYEKISVRDLMYMPEFFISPNDPMEVIVDKFKSCGRYNLAVLDEGKYIGFISRARVFSVYRDTMADLSFE
ncbi:chloride channel protein [Aquipluma nitroreducens]|uniref:Chloride channel protein n=1 Tax=Aquipluma nitroreducens TaxID=2010828 RepID=A0A5K7SHI2_9BACT|nr:chloride channel protein [Aquipluma nitroreducens]BBE20814.1 chloride channel protein [Aquipluma nitroreducens]